MSAALNRNSWRSLEPFMGSDVPNREVVLLEDVKSLLEVTRVVSLTCENLHHSKAEGHGIGEPCPVEARIISAIEKAMRSV